MSEHKLPREPHPDAADRESFTINEPELGLTTTVREATDEQLERHIKMNSELQARLQAQIGQMLNQHTQIARGVCMLEYEQDRRRRTITIATDLSSIHGLRKQ